MFSISYNYGRITITRGTEEWINITSSGVCWDSVRRGELFSLPFKIIQRNGIPFMWPEHEEA